MYIHNNAVIKNVFASDFIDHVTECVTSGDMVSFEVLSEVNVQLYNARYCSAADFIKFIENVNTNVINEGTCLVVKTSLANGNFSDTVYVVNGE